MSKLDAKVLHSELTDNIISFGESKSFTKQKPDLLGRNPDALIKFLMKKDIISYIILIFTIILLTT